jgi:hypothetical protein
MAEEVSKHQAPAHGMGHGNGGCWGYGHGQLLPRQQG